MNNHVMPEQKAKSFSSMITLFTFLRAQSVITEWGGVVLVCLMTR